MNNNINTKNNKHFWNAHQACVYTNRISPDHSPFYMRRAQAFDRHFPEKQIIEAFLSDLAVRPQIAAWQVKQARYALRMLCEEGAFYLSQDWGTRLNSYE